jgi:MFS family permease
MVAAGFMIQAVCYGSMVTYGIFFNEFQAEFGWSRAVISGAWALSFFIMGPIGIIAGRLNDKIGPRVIIIGSSISFGMGYILMSMMQAPWHLYLLYGVMVCIGFGSHDVITLSTAARWFTRRRGIASGIVKVGTGFGQLLIPMIAAWLITAYGWRRSYFLMGVGALVILLAAAMVLRRDPRELGLFPDNARNESSSAGDGSANASIPLKTAWITRQFWTLCLSELFAFFCLLTVVVHIVPHATDLGISPSIAAGVISTIGGVSMLGRLVLGTANDRIGGKRTLMISYAILLCSLIWLQAAREMWMLYLFAVVYGFAHGGFFTVMSPTVAEVFGTGSHGVIFGMVLFFGTFGGAVGPLLAGYVFDVTGSYQMIFFTLAAAAMIGLVLISLLRPLHK